MPVIPTYTRQVSAVASLPDGRPAQGSLGSAVQGVVTVAEAFEEGRRVTELNQARTTAAVRLSEIAGRASRGPWQEAQSTFENEAKALYGELRNGFSNGQAAKQFEMDWLSLYSPKDETIKNYAFRGEADFNVAKLEESVYSLSQARASADTEAERDSITLLMQNAIDDNVKAGWIDATDGGKLWRNFLGDGARLDAMRMIRSDPYAARKALEAGEFADLDPFHRESLLNSADAEIKSREAEARARANEARMVYASDFDNYITRLSFTGEMDEGMETQFSPERLKGVLGAERGQQAVDLLASAKRQAVNRKIIATASPDELGTILAQSAERVKASANPKIAAEEYKDLLSLVRERQAALSADPAAFVSRSPALRGPLEAYAAAAQSQDEAAMASATDAVVTASIAEQVRLGVPEYAVKPLSEGQVRDLVGRIGAASPEDMARTVRGTATQYGSHWPKVVAQLGNKLDPAATALILADSPQTEALLVEAMREGPEALRKGIDEPKRVMDALASNELLDTLRRSLSGQAGGISTYNQVLQAAEILALARVKKYGESPSVAAEGAIQGILGGQAFGEVNSQPFRIPQALAGERAVLEEGAYGYLKMFNAEGIDLPPIPDGADAERARKSYAAAVRRDGYFFNEGNNRGLYLWDGQAVVRRNGEPILFTWDQLKAGPSEKPPREPLWRRMPGVN